MKLKDYLHWKHEKNLKKKGRKKRSGNSKRQSKNRNHDS